tara:strand:+ start:6872 stop:7144 length:273 start_codon:yes stop_codon:yes gene_type:complete
LQRERILLFTGKKRQHTIIIPFTQQKVYYYIVYICKASRLSLFFFFSVEERELELGVGMLFARVFALTILMILRAITAAFFFLGELQHVY